MQSIFHETFRRPAVSQTSAAAQPLRFIQEAVPLQFPAVSIEQASKSSFDAIVVGAGAVGGLAAALLCEAGLRVLLLDAGLPLRFRSAPVRRSTSALLGVLSDQRLLSHLPHALMWRGEKLARFVGRRRQPIQSRCYAWPSAVDLFVDDLDNPYDTDPDAPFNWIRAHGIGGRMAVPLHGRQYYRHGLRDFRPVDGLAPAWPFEPCELSPFYEQVEKLLGVSGGCEESPWVPDSRLADLRRPSPAEQRTLERVAAAWPRFTPILGRYALPFDGIGAATRTGRLSLRRGAVAAEVLVGNGRTTGVRFFDRENRSFREARAPVVMMGAGALESTRILLNSCEGKLAAGSGMLGANLMDHVSIKVQGRGPDLGPPIDPPNLGRCIYLPRFDGRAAGHPGNGRGYGVRVYHNPGHSGVSHFTGVADGEMMPRSENRVRLSTRKDAWGIPVLHIRARHSHLEREIARAQGAALEELAAVLDVRLDAPAGGPGVPGSAIHECGTARMGTDPASSVVDPFNQCWDAAGLYVTDGAAFPSEGLQNPTLTMMALTARACAQVAGR